MDFTFNQCSKIRTANLYNLPYRYKELNFKRGVFGDLLVCIGSVIIATAEAKKFDLRKTINKQPRFRLAFRVREYFSDTIYLEKPYSPKNYPSLDEIGEIVLRNMSNGRLR